MVRAGGVIHPHGHQHLLSAGDFCVVPQGQHFFYLNRESREAQMCLVHAPSFDLNSEVFVEKSDG